MTTASRPKILAARLLTFAAVGLFACPLAAQDSLGDFQLRPGPTSTPQAQGPVTEGVPAPRVAPTPTPTPAPVPTIQPPVTATPVPVQVPTIAPVRAPATPAARTGAQATPAPTQSVAEPTLAPSPAAPSPTAPLALPTAAPPASAPAPASQVSAVPASAPASGTNWWRWVAGLVLLGAGAAAGYAFARRRRVTEEVVEAPEIERPRITPKPVTATSLMSDSSLVPSGSPAASAASLPPTSPPPLAPVPEGEGLSLALEARQMSLTLTAAALAYRVTITNNGRRRLTGVTVAGDMISAHSSLSEDEQRANVASELLPVHQIESLAAGETTQITGEFRLPFNRIRPIRKGKAALFVPLARLKVNTADGGNSTVLLTALVGQRSREPGAGLQPFRLDFGPRIYREVTQRIF